jgi:drug/metabolite transporter (DMT)-like permease
MVATRFVVDQTGPASLALLRYAIGFCCLLPVVLLSAERTRFARRDLLPIALLGITQFGILIAVLNYGLRYIPSGRAALIFATFPLLTMVLAAALGHERLTLPKILGVLDHRRPCPARGHQGGAHAWTGGLLSSALCADTACCTGPIS